MDQRNRWLDRIRLCIPPQKINLYSISGRLLRIDFIQIWKAIHSDFDQGLLDMFEYARNTGTRGQTY